MAATNVVWLPAAADDDDAHLQLAYTAYQPPATFEGCIKPWGVDSIQAISKTVPAFYANAVAHVMRVGKERLFIVFKGSDASNWMQNVECAHTGPLGDLFGAKGSDVRLHSGFYAGWHALEKDVTAAVLSFAKEVSRGNAHLFQVCSALLRWEAPALLLGLQAAFEAGCWRYHTASDTIAARCVML
jgi:hypothetical protein